MLAARPVEHQTDSGAVDRFRPDIEGLRGIAVLLVVLYHSRVGPFTGGFIGVDVFFVLSGYLITGLLVREVESTGRLRFFRFYARRARRLLPASIVVLFATIIASAALLSVPEQLTIARAARATAAYLSNFWFMSEASDYFAPQIETNPFLHTWSLAVEEQFYAVWPLVVALGLWRSGSRRRLALILGVLFVVSLGLCIYVTGMSRVWAFYAMPVRGWEFAAGGLAALTPRHWLRPRLAYAGWVGLLALVLAAIAYSKATAFPGWAAAIPAGGTALMLLSHVANPSSALTALLKRRVFQWLGRLSYSWYLWHWPFLAFASALWPGLTPSWRLCLSGASLGAAALAFRFVEDPIRSSRRLATRTGLSLAMGACLTVAGVAAAQSWRWYALDNLNNPMVAELVDASRDTSRLDALGCFAQPTETKPRECSFGPAQAAQSIVLMGDSHAEHWFPALERLALTKGIRLTTFLKASCPWPAVTPYNFLIGRVEPECAEWRTAALARIESMRPSVVVVSSFSPYVKDESQTQQISTAVWQDGAAKTLTRLSKAVPRVVVLLDTPQAAMPVPTCLGRAAIHSWYSDAGCEPRLYSETRTAERVAASGFPTVAVLDLSDQFCNGRCEPVQRGLIVYRDQHHMTATYSASLASILGKRLGL